MGSLLLGQEAMRVEHPMPPLSATSLRLRKFYRTPQEMVQSMVAQDQARRKEPGATVEVIGYDDEAALELLALKVANTTRLEFRITDKLQHQELREFMQQDPRHPSPVLIIPLLAGGSRVRTDDQWLK